MAMHSISKRYVFCLLNTSELVKHKFWDCIQARRAWRWATSIMHELCGVRIGNYDSFHWKQAMFGERIQKKICKQIIIWHLLTALRYGLYGLSGMTKFSTKNNGMNPKSNIIFGVNLSCMPRWLGRE